MLIRTALFAGLLLAPILFADSKSQAYSDFTTPLPLKQGGTLILGIVGGWERWDNPVRFVRRTAIAVQRKQLPGVWVETVENHKLDLAERLVREAFDTNLDGKLSREEASQARVRLFGQSLGGRAALRLARTLNQWGVPVELVIVVDAFGRDPYTVPPNVKRAANFYQRDHIVIKGAPEIRAEDTVRTQILCNKQLSYRDRNDIGLDDEPMKHRLFMGAHILLEYDAALWAAIVTLLTNGLHQPSQ